METVTGYSFRRDDLRVADRVPGISAFMRIRNGEDFLEASIRTHIDHFDEIVAVYNQCTDATPEILARLAAEYGPKLRVFHYAERVHPPGSAAHAAEPADSPNSLVNYYNFALSRTRFAYATKLDDDHLAIPGQLERVCARLRAASREQDGRMHCFSGPNLARDGDGLLTVPAFAALSGAGDIGFFRVGGDTFFERAAKHERFRRGGLKRVFAGFLYWHLKFLKEGQGFANYELESNAGGRYERRLGELRTSRMLDLPRLRLHVRPYQGDRLLALVSEKRRVILDRNHAVSTSFPHDSFEAALDETSPGWRKWL